MRLLFFILLISNLFPQSLKELYKRGYVNLENDLTIVDEHQNEIFSFFAPLGVDDNENIFVRDNKKCCFLKFDKNGKFISKISKQGKGPGEITSYGVFELDVSGNLLVHDFGAGRMSIIDNSGKFKSSYKAAPGKYIAQYKTLTNGNFILEFTDFPSGLSKSREETKRIEIFSPKMEKRFTLTSIKIEGFQKIVVDGMVIVTGNGFNEKFLWNVLPDGNIVTASSRENQISIYSPSGKLIKQFNSNAERREITEKDKEAQMNSHKPPKNDRVETENGEITTVKLGEAKSKKIREKLEFPKKTPFFSKLVIDNEGNILLKSYFSDDKNDMWHAYTSGGEYINKVKIPKFFDGIIKKGKLYQIEKSDDAVDIKRYIIN